MSQLPTPDVAARKLLEAFGLDGMTQAAARAENCRQAGDVEGVRFWNTVVRTMRLIELQQDSGEAEPDGFAAPAGPILWRLMQRVEHCRHRAAECRRQAQGAPEALRAELLQIEQNWLELAAYAELLADRPEP